MNRIIIENKLGHSVKALKLQFPEKKKKNQLEIHSKLIKIKITQLTIAKGKIKTNA